VRVALVTFLHTSVHGHDVLRKQVVSIFVGSVQKNENDIESRPARRTPPHER